MSALESMGKTYYVDEDGFLIYPDQWDKNFAECMAPKAGISGSLTPKHWEVLEFIRKYYAKNGTRPKVYKACKAQRMRLADLAALFPSGYRRGACRLAGLPYYAEDISHTSYSKEAPATGFAPAEGKVYRVNSAGYLVDASEWDEDFATSKMKEMKMGRPGPKHFQIIEYLRERYEKTGKVPTVYETCFANGIELDELEHLFPDGYHRGAVKIAGLR